MIRQRGILALVILLLSGCAASGPSLEESPVPLEVRFPADGYVVAWGISEQSARQAELAAKAAVAEQVRSSIKSELVSVMEAESQDGVITDYEKLESRINTTSHFDHAELIRVVPETATFKNGVHQVFAAMSRREAVTELLIPYENEAISFRLLSTQLESLEFDPPHFTQVWRQMKPRRERLLPLAAEVRAVAGRTLPEIAADNARWEAAESARAQLLNDLNVVVDLAGHPDLDDKQVSSLVREALAGLGLGAVDESCQAGALELVIRPEVIWKNVMGKVAQLDFSGQAGLCYEEDLWTEFRISDSRFRGEGRRPVEDLMNRVQAEDLTRSFREILAPYLPF